MSSIDSRLPVSFAQATWMIGLEVHVQLDTESKLFCGCSTAYGAAPNTLTCPVCAGMPGALPVANEQALFLAIKTGLALNCQIARQTSWDRKHYFYPDLPKGYQISQLDRPVCGKGFLEVVDPQGTFEPRHVVIERCHLEEDAGKSIHDDSAISESGPSKIDLNRAGVPLLEIVTCPDLRSPAETKAFLIELKLILTYLGVSPCIMAHGNLRFDANINLHLTVNNETVATPIVELKNLNSFRAVERALTFEGQRQFDAWKELGHTADDTPKQTRGWNDTQQTTFPQREKETSSDYRFLPEPDLPSILITEEEIDSIETALEINPLPSQWREFLIDCHGLRKPDANAIVGQGREVVDYFLSVVGENGDSRSVCNWITQSVFRHLREENLEMGQYPIAPVQMRQFLKLISNGELEPARGREVLDEMVKSNLDAPEAIIRLGIAQVSQDELEILCLQLIDDNPNIVQEIRDGNIKSIGALIGQARKLNPNVNPAMVGLRIEKLLD